jgi:hypothetical protein
VPQVHNIGKQHFVQFVRFPVKWGFKLMVRGWTQEIEAPFRTAKPFIFRMPNYHALVYGKWTGAAPDEETALNRAIGKRVLADEDFQEGWEAPAYKVRETSL